MKGKNQRLAELQKSIAEIEPKEALALQQQGAVLLDVRENDEVANGSPNNALRLGRGFLELKIEEQVPDSNRTLLVMCAGGSRSLFAADSLKNLGYEDVRSVAGGFNRWKNNGLAFEVPRMLDAEGRERYSRHLLLPEVGETGQIKLLESKVLLIGAGGLGSPAAYYLAAAGVGTLGLVDHDVVDRSNLQRQIIHTDARVGTPKVASAKEAITALNPDVNVIGHETHLNSENVDDIFSQYDLILDGTDNLPTRYLINDACVKHDIANIHAAVYRFEGQITVFWPKYEKRRGGCYRCMFPTPPPPGSAPSCSEIGVLGVLPGVMGLLQAVEAVKILLNVGDPLVGRMMYYDALAASFSEFKLKRKENCRFCGDGAEIGEYEDVAQICAAPNA
ncbi:MAG: molybdopterin-synthase adenylyltransferase MoeB [Gammaproteobacteria bacterium]|nr:molybdopterin-synthase adenylyltransferase MoeB [Gammaproteobacteria bacterium]